eukprot:7629271-Alexandrium_andersonii.AAC.1
MPSGTMYAHQARGDHTLCAGSAAEAHSGTHPPSFATGLSPRKHSLKRSTRRHAVWPRSTADLPASPARKCQPSTR